MKNIIRVAVPLGCLLGTLLVLTPDALATQPPTARGFVFDQNTQTLTINWNGHGKVVDYDVDSSSVQTGFNGAAPLPGQDPPWIGPLSWTLDSGAAPIGAIHTLTLTVSNAHGNYVRNKPLMVIAGSKYAPPPIVPGYSFPAILISGIGIVLVGWLLIRRRVMC